MTATAAATGRRDGAGVGGIGLRGCVRAHALDVADSGFNSCSVHEYIRGAQSSRTMCHGVVVAKSDPFSVVLMVFI